MRRFDPGDRVRNKADGCIGEVVSGPRDGITSNSWLYVVWFREAKGVADAESVYCDDIEHWDVISQLGKVADDPS